LEGISPDPTPVVRELVAQVKILETEGSPVSMPVDRVLLDITRTPGLRGYELLLAAKAVTRIYVLSALVASDLKTHFVFYPQKSINIYQSSFLRRNIYLDFGGINGDELVYPRYADLLVRGKEPYRVAPPNHVASIPTDGAAVSLARDVRGIVDLVLTDLGARRSRLA
jgi:hypothetical protein